MADGSERPPVWSDISQRLQNLRNLLSSERHLGADQRRAIEFLDREMEQMSAERSGTETRPGDSDLESNPPLPGRDLLSAPNSPPPTTSPSTLVRTRRRAFRPSERLQRYQRERLGSGARLGATDAYASPSTMSPVQPSVSGGGERLRSKRRKLDDGTYEEEPTTFCYGRNGQVVPGQLRMELASCDGGDGGDADPHASVHSNPHNLLQDDTAVYCSKSNKCDILLKHAGGMPFTLTKMTIKAPRTGFDARGQEGLIFVAMDDDRILERTSQYDLKWPSKAYRSRSDRYRPSQDYLNSVRSPLHAVDRSSYLHNPQPSFTDDERGLEASLVPGFHVTITDPSDDEDTSPRQPSPVPWEPAPRSWHDDEYSLRSYVDRYRPVYRRISLHDDGSSETSSESEAYEPEPPPEEDQDAEGSQQTPSQDAAAQRNRTPELTRIHGFHGAQAILNEQVGRARHSAHGRTAGPATEPAHLQERSGPSDNAVGSSSSKHACPAAGDISSKRTETLIPHAQFFISRNKSGTAVNFDPPISGRYVLIKVFAQCPDANIDIQAILAQGYGGPRFFPSIETR